MQNYNPQEIEKKWQDIWEKTPELFKAKDFDTKPKFYMLFEFPYPSGDGLHMGHLRGQTTADIISRKKRMEGFNVMLPIGWDAFGLPAENYAIKHKIKPSDAVAKNIETFTKQEKSLGYSFDWSREINTTDPEYFKWTQWLFLKFYEHGLAYKKKMAINWCPSCKIGLANEEVIDNKCERCGTESTKREVDQWMLRITAYADKLLDGLKNVDYPERVRAMQENWIGRSEGINIWYNVDGLEEKITVYTTRPDTNFGATFIVVAPESEFVKSSFEHFNDKESISKYIEESNKKSDIERIAEGRKKTGVFTGLYATNHLTDRKMPIYISDFVLANVGTGCVVGVPGHDIRDFEFAQEKGLDIIRVVIGKDGDISPITKSEQVQEENGKMINSEFLDGLDIHEATKKIKEYLVEKGWGTLATTYHLRDWIFSRQHYWGEPIPIIHCEKCGMVPVPENQLPVKLPDVEHYEPTDTGESPLAKITDWVNTICPKCGGKAKRETDTMPNWAGSSWYFLRYIDPKNDKEFASFDKLKYWMNVDIYEGGPEHITLHLLYSRFWNLFFYDLGLVPTSEPYAKRIIHGMILAEDGRKMSKSLGNVINPTDIVAKYGADATRAYEIFIGPYDQDAMWSSQGIEGTARFLSKIWNLGVEISERVEEKDLAKIITDSFEIGETELEVATHKVIKKFNDDMNRLHLNTLISTLMEFTNFLITKKDLLYNYPQPYLVLILLLSPICPHITEEIWEMFGFSESLSSGRFSWPKHDPEKIKEDTVSIVVQENGKLRGNVLVANDAEETEVISACSNVEKLKELPVGVKKTIYIKNRLINFVK